MQRQVLVILQKGLHFTDMNDEDKSVHKIVKNAFDYYAFSKIVVHFQFIYLKSIECFKRKGIWTHTLLQCHQQMVYLLTDPACKFFFSA